MRYKPILLFLITLVTLMGCEVDDICTETVLTPKMIVRFYDITNSTMPREVSHLYVWAEDKDSLYKDSTTDSIALPLNTNAVFTKYLLSTNNVIDTLYISYDKQEIFVSRSCGFKYNFELTDATDLTHYWTQSLEMISTPQIISNEAAAHLKILH